MHLSTLPFDTITDQTASDRLSLRDQTAQFFKQRPNQWIPAATLSQFGIGGWRTRVSEVRRDLGMNIENRQRRLKNRMVISEYRYVARREVPNA